MDEAISYARATEGNVVWGQSTDLFIYFFLCSHSLHTVVFFDEINTCKWLGLFKEIVCDRRMRGVVLPTNLVPLVRCFHVFVSRALITLVSGCL
jgi:hypothetical protein